LPQGNVSKDQRPVPVQRRLHPAQTGGTGAQSGGPRLKGANSSLTAAKGVGLRQNPLNGDQSGGRSACRPCCRVNLWEGCTGRHQEKTSKRKGGARGLHLLSASFRFERFKKDPEPLPKRAIFAHLVAGAAPDIGRVFPISKDLYIL
jgi:hypothetical protein